MATWFKRCALFLGLNIAVITTVSILLHLLGAERYVTEYGLDLRHLAIFCLAWGMCGSFISLAVSRMVAKWTYGIQLLHPGRGSASENELVEIVHRLAKAAGLPAMPEVGIYDSPDLNAFATGPTKARSLVAVSTGLLGQMNRDQITAVLGHEVSHIANGDMVTMTLLQGVVNAFVMFLSRVIAYAITIGRDDENRSRSYFAYSIVQLILQIVFMILGSLIVAWFSRQREFRADAGGGRLAGKERMASALESLKRSMEVEDERYTGRVSPAMQTLMISSKPSGFLSLWSTHPPLEERIARLRES